MTNYLRKLPPLSTLSVFEAAHRLRSFTRAGEELALSQASVSRRIRQLESDLGVSLFERLRYDVAPTEYGDTLARTVRLSLGELSAVADEIRAKGAGFRGFTIASDLSIAAALISPNLGEFQRRYPDLKIRILSSYEPLESVTEEFDVGFQLGRWAEHRFDIEPIADDAVFPVCSPALAKTLPSPVNPEDLLHQPLLHLEDVGRKWPDWRSFLAHFRIREPEPDQTLVFNSYQVCLDVAQQGEGIALGWARSVQPKLDAGLLVRIPGMTIPQPDIINAYQSNRTPPNPLVLEFIQLLRARLPPIDD